MIEATELRLNNYVLYNGIVMSVTAIESPKPRKEKRFDGKYIVELFDGTGFITATTDQAEGIQLNEEILLKCGYRLKNPNAMAYSHESGAMPYLYETITGAYNMSTGKPLNYLHELQNRIYSLRDVELNVKIL